MSLRLANKSLFLDFFVIEYQWYKKHEPQPKKFFTDDNILKSIKAEYQEIDLCFVDSKPMLSDTISPQTLNKIIDPRTNIIASVNTKDYDQSIITNKVIRNASPNQERFSALACTNFQSLAPHGFIVDQVNDDESVDINFPSRYCENLPKGETIGFFCQKEPRNDGEWFSRGILLILFVKNYGLHEQIEIESPDSFARRLKNDHLLSPKRKIRDFRKSSLLFELG